MKTLKDYDKNFDVFTASSGKDIVFRNVFEEPFKIYGLIDKENYRRLPRDISVKVSEGVDALCQNTAGGRVRFKTNSLYIALKAFVPSVNLMPHMALAGSLGFDVYERKDGEYLYLSTMFPGWGIDAINDIGKRGYFDCLVEFKEKRMRDITINFPLYNNVDDIFIGVEKSSELLSGDGYTNKKTVVYYGSSITQGGCASRPGNCYPSILSRRFDNDFYNMGFSGNAKGEDEMANYIAGMPMDIFVYDYDHNAPSVAHLEATHEKMFKTVRKAHPDLPIVIMPRPKYYLNDDEKKRRDIILKTYNNAVSSGDKNVYYIDNKDLTADCRDEGTVDGCHPNDFGFASMAKAVGSCLEGLM